jgi:ATP-dependent DNA helicase RecQ
MLVFRLGDMIFQLRSLYRLSKPSLHSILALTTTADKATHVNNSKQLNFKKILCHLSLLSTGKLKSRSLMALNRVKQIIDFINKPSESEIISEGKNFARKNFEELQTLKQKSYHAGGFDDTKRA